MSNLEVGGTLSTGEIQIRTPIITKFKSAQFFLQLNHINFFFKCQKPADYIGCSRLLMF